MLVDISAALAALDLDPDDPADAVDIGSVLALVDRRENERRLLELGHPAVTGPRIRRVAYEPPTRPVWPSAAEC